jgi:metal iron transporter
LKVYLITLSQPSIIISVAVGRRGIDSLLVGSQVLLSMVLPFVVLPLIYFTSSKSGLMRVTTSSGTPTTADGDRVDEVVDFASAWYVTWLGYFLVVVMIASNIYALVQLARGQT